MLFQGILGIMTGVGIATLAAVGLLIYLNQQNEPNHTTRSNYRRAEPRPTWSGYKATDENTCSICLDMIDLSDRFLLSCGHVFHQPCISKWFSNERKICPNCRKAI